MIDRSGRQSRPESLNNCSLRDPENANSASSTCNAPTDAP